MFITNYKLSNIDYRFKNSMQKKSYIRPLSPSQDIFFGSKKDLIKGDQIARTQITRLTQNGLKKTLDAIVTLEKIKDFFSNREKIVYRLYSPDKKLLGHTRIEDTKVNNFVNFDFQYGINPEMTNYIFGGYLESINDKSYKGIGQKLIQISIEQSIKNGHKGRFKFSSEHLINEHRLRELPSSYGCPTGFYYEKCHFRSDPLHIEIFSQKNDRDIEEELARVRSEGKDPSEADLNFIKMYLPENEFKNFWWPKIKNNPIILSKDEIEKFEIT